MGKSYSPRKIKYDITVFYCLAVLVPLIRQDAERRGMVHGLFLLTIADIDLLFIEY